MTVGLNHFPIDVVLADSLHKGSGRAKMLFGPVKQKVRRYPNLLYELLWTKSCLFLGSSGVYTSELSVCKQLGTLISIQTLKLRE